MSSSTGDSNPRSPGYGGAGCNWRRAMRPMPPSRSSERRSFASTSSTRDLQHASGAHGPPASSSKSASATSSIWPASLFAFSAMFEICRDDRICRQGKCQNSGRERDSLIRAKISLIARFNSLQGGKKFPVRMRRELARKALNSMPLFGRHWRAGEPESMKFPVFSLPAGNLASETGSLVTAPSSGESANSQFLAPSRCSSGSKSPPRPCVAELVEADLSMSGRRT